MSQITMLTPSGTQVVVPRQVMKTILGYVVPSERSKEAGGVFIGAHHGQEIEVVDCTVPLPTDVRERYLFDRKDPGHQAAAIKAWRDSESTLTYVGEWHSHPEDYPSPSFKDRRTWSKVMKRRSKVPFFFMIQGWRGAWYGLGQAGKLTVLKISMD